MTGRYEVRDTTRLGVPVVEVRWAVPGQPPSLVLVLDASRVPLLCQALRAYLDGGEPPR